MAKPIEDLRKQDWSKLGPADMQVGMDGALQVWGEWGKSWQAIAAEMSDYSKRSFEDGTQTLEKLVTARSIEQAMEIQSSYAKRSCDEYMRQMSRIGTMYTDLAKDAGKPVERLLQAQR